MSDPIERLTELFEKFPGIGPRQAQRFVQFLLRSSPAARREMVDAIQHLGGSVHQCQSCMRFFAGEGKICSICSNDARDRAQLAIVASDADLSALERSGTYRGMYFVLGGTVSLASEKMTGLRTKELLASIPARAKTGLNEIILAFPANPEGDATATRLREEIAAQYPVLEITTLGRGLSTGSELEYADPETLKSALENRR
ncbi:MAG TPA: toprim domain-containing protein [Candidatus Paceibacterota bacterium]|nr:toprim domain-containing protein [Candidatus Paceibacterota bacterium]